MLVFRASACDVYYNRAKIQSLQSPYSAEETAGVYYYQIQDTMYLAHPSHPPKKIVRSANSDGSVVFSMQDVAFVNGPYLDENETDVTLTFDGTTITASADVFGQGDAGRWVRLITVADLKITAVTNAKTAAAE